ERPEATAVPPREQEQEARRSAAEAGTDVGPEAADEDGPGTEDRPGAESDSEITLQVRLPKPPPAPADPVAPTAPDAPATGGAPAGPGTADPYAIGPDRHE
ncbi:hypothetical protein G3I48_23645, partial [Streptomyces griseus]|nr:hypothetical protein [Streptomyces griseus]